VAKGYQKSDRSEQSFERAKHVIDLLVAKVPELTWSNCQFRFPIQDAVIAPKLLAYLLTKPSDVYREGPTAALGSAALSGNPESISILLDSGVNVCGLVGYGLERPYVLGTDALEDRGEGREGGRGRRRLALMHLSPQVDGLLDP
jgi:hypothetical protein